MNKEEIKKEFEKVWKELVELKNRIGNKSSEKVEEKDKRIFIYNFSNKKLNHNDLLAELLKSEECHSIGGITREEILEVFKQNGRPVVKKKVNDLLNVWKKRKKIEAIKEDGNLRYFWIENETNTSK